MTKTLPKTLFYLLILGLLNLNVGYGQTITLGTIDPGPYGAGSSITVPITVGGDCINRLPKSDSDKVYKLFLSDASGNFSNQKLIGWFAGNFYTTFINGTIPSGTPVGSGYKLKATFYDTVAVSNTSAAFTINSGKGVLAAVSSQFINEQSFPDVFGTCSNDGKKKYSYIFADKSTSGSTVSASFFNEITKVTEGAITPTSVGSSFDANAANYTITVKASKDGIIGTRSYILMNNTVNNNIGNKGAGTVAVCLVDSVASLTYTIDYSTLKTNYPGLLYTITWGDGGTTKLNYCQIVANQGQVTHIFKTSSCGYYYTSSQPNTFEIDIRPSSPFCGNQGITVSTGAQVIRPPTNKIQIPIAACVGSTVNLTNASDPGQDPNSSDPNDCMSTTGLYTWIVDGKVIGSNYPYTQSATNVFTTTGTHTITLKLQNPTSNCPVLEATTTICIQKPPIPKFTLPVTKACLPATIKPVNQSFIDANCNPTNKFIWIVTGPSRVSYASNTDSTSAAPQFIFKSTGIYKIQLGISTISCDTIRSAVQTVVVDSATVAKLSPNVIICGNNQTFSFSPLTGPTQTLLTGSSQNVAGTYLWTITGGSFSFEGGTSDTSKYPNIKFSSLSTYTITVSNTNACGVAAKATQQLTIRDAPIISAGIDTTICGNKQYPLKATSTGNGVKEYRWLGGKGTFMPADNVLNPSYLPSPSEIKSGMVTLVLLAVTSSANPCDSLLSKITLTLSAPDSVNSARKDTVCSGTTLNYQITASQPGSTFTWDIDPSKTSATATGYKANGNGPVITDNLINNDPSDYAVVTYNITTVSANGDGCSSDIFPLTVYIAPKEDVAKFTQDVSSGCDSLRVHFTNTSVPANISYIWNFGDGTLQSTATNPVHTFFARADGKDTVYTITLTAASNCGISKPFTSTVVVRPQIPIAFISPQLITTCSPFVLTVNNLSPGSNLSYTYYLYDGSNLLKQITTTDKNPVQFDISTTNSSKEYSLQMIATSFCGTTGKSSIIPIKISPSNVIAQMFVDNGETKGCAPLNVGFTNNSIGGETYFYNIFDANHNQIDKVQCGPGSTPYTFNTAGIFFVTISAINSCTSIQSTETEVDVYEIPAPSFKADVTTRCRSVITNFANQTPDAINAPATSLNYEWDFGDGTAHAFGFTPPPHVYNYKNSPFTVTLTATNTATNCTNTNKLIDYINVSPPPATAFSENPDSIAQIPNYRFLFIDQTVGNPIAWNWSFGDGQSSTSQNPGHTYVDSGLFKVMLTTTTQAGCDSQVTHYVRINGVPGQLFLPNAFEPDGGITELKTFTAKGSGIKQWHMQIFNSYAELIWETTKLNDKGAPIDGWDGTYKGQKAQQGVYVWQVSATFINGTEWKGNTYKNSLPKRTGVVHLIR